MRIFPGGTVRKRSAATSTLMEKKMIQITLEPTLSHQSNDAYNVPNTAPMNSKMA